MRHSLRARPAPRATRRVTVTAASPECSSHTSTVRACTALRVTSSLSYKETRLLWSPGSLAAGSHCSQQPNSSQIRGGDGWGTGSDDQNCHFWGGGASRRGSLREVQTSAKGRHLGTEGKRGGTRQSHVPGGSTVLGAEVTGLCHRGPFLERLRDWATLD